ncbi:MAG: hypothetical protein NC203_01640 [Firmicutes bacterium]|nr:hypothetical protein [[Eubacterium] siraeum]MCM1487044.1 hypothetical protein [Bacillota bacterium]
MKGFNVKKAAALLPFLLCLSFCACNSKTLPISTDASHTVNQPDAAQTKIGSIAEKTEAESEKPEENAVTEEFNFASVLTEDDIEYMGIPYSELTQEQFIQLWAQATRECNVQRLYNLYYSNRSYDESLSGAEVKRLSDSDVREWLQTLLALELNGRMLFGYYDVELHEIDDAPKGYYDNKETEELRYTISYKSKMYENGELTYEGDEIRWIDLKKINGYWKIGVWFSSSP